MKHFIHLFPSTQVKFVDFLVNDPKELTDTYERAIECVIAVMNSDKTRDGHPDFTESEEVQLLAFGSWFSDFATKGASVNASYPRYSNSADLPANTVFSLVNRNSGIGITFIGCFRDTSEELTPAGYWF
jgi:hypothetical protein